jgi:hypothetical protein
LAVVLLELIVFSSLFSEFLDLCHPSHPWGIPFIPRTVAALILTLDTEFSRVVLRLFKSSLNPAKWIATTFSSVNSAEPNVSTSASALSSQIPNVVEHDFF